MDTRRKHTYAKIYVFVSLLVVGLVGVVMLVAQPAQAQQGESFGGGAYAPTDEMSSAERQAIKQRLNTILQQLKTEGKYAVDRTQAVEFDFPLKALVPITDDGYFGITNFVDHDEDYPNELLDYNCGERTYDSGSGYNHQGIDFATWPYAWNKMDNDAVAVIAAAPGTLISIDDGNFDRSCGFNGNPWNAVYVAHADGSIAWYGHLKNGTTIAKSVGDTVVAGEQLGIVGSSGNSTAPHLHLEVYDADFNLIDPYSGSCNSLNSDSWWASQEPYSVPTVMRITTGEAATTQNCPDPEVTNEKETFAPNDLVYFTFYYRDQSNSLPSEYRILRPDGSLHNSWSQTINVDHYGLSWWYWSRFVGNEIGEWTIEVEFNDETFSKSFHVAVPTAVIVSAESTTPSFNTVLAIPALVFGVIILFALKRNTFHA